MSTEFPDFTANPDHYRNGYPRPSHRVSGVSAQGSASSDRGGVVPTIPPHSCIFPVLYRRRGEKVSRGHDLSRTGRVNDHRMSPPLILIGGPTASGKSALALALAEEFSGTVINADSMQVYRDLAILTARPGAADEARAPHRLYGV